MDNLQHLCSFLSGSAKRKAIVRKHFKLSHSADELFADLDENDQFVANSGRQSLSVLCTTRWLSRVDSVSTLLLNYSAVEESLHEISETSTGQAQRDAESYIRLVKDFTFMFAAVTCAYFLGFLRPLTIALQSHQCDLLKAHNDARDVIETVKSVRTDETCMKLFKEAESIAQKFGVTATKPRSVARQQQRANAPSSDITEYYKLNFYFPVLDHFVSHLNDRFPENSHAYIGFNLVPSKVGLVDEECMNKIVEEYETDLPTPSHFPQEVYIITHFIYITK